MDNADLTIEILQGLRSDIQALGQTLAGRIDETNARLEQANARLDRLAEGQVRLGTQLNERLLDVEAEVRRMNDRLDNVLIGPMGKTVREHEDRIKRIEQRLEL